MTTARTTPADSTSDWAGSPLSTLHHLARQARSLPVEQYSDETGHVIRLEVPGIDPAQDLAVSVETGSLTVRCERRHAGLEDGLEDDQSEFRYGSFARTVALPLGANIHDVSATCRDGILTVRVGMQPEYQKGARRIPVQVEP
ncbi:MAG TPA: Hsp20/alpha crystallin family protein [Streptosporangiaceae bacterium]|nr:Hsp20/alpha crystallin family protein [Streptosporangiaceae bacterium]